MVTNLYAKIEIIFLAGNRIPPVQLVASQFTDSYSNFIVIGGDDINLDFNPLHAMHEISRSETLASMCKHLSRLKVGVGGFM